MEDYVYRGSAPWDGIVLDTGWVEYLKSQTSKSWQCEISPKADYEGYADDEAYIQAKSTIPNILYKLNGTEVECIVDEQGNVDAIYFTKKSNDETATAELKRLLKLLKFKPAIRKGITVKCIQNFRYNGNKSLLQEDKEEQTSNVEAEKK